jgi:four helix bundle protein
MAFDHEKLDVYQLAVDFVGVADAIVQTLPNGRAYLRDQLRRAAASIPLNIAEGAAKWSRKDKARFYDTARGSAMECAAILDVLRRLDLDGDNVCPSAKLLLERTVSMLIRLARPSG